MSSVSTLLSGDILDATPSLANPQAADLIVAYLEQLGIEYVFGIPGGAIEPLYNALARSERRGGPRHVLARHESGAAFMADGYARETGKIGVCCATSGPGATNLLTAVACAYDNRIPMLVITGQPRLSLFGKAAFQESACTGINTLGIFQHCTRYNTLVSHPEQLERKLVNAVIHAFTSPAGPVHLSIPVDILRSPVGQARPSYPLHILQSRPALIDPSRVRSLATEIKSASSMVILIGGGAECGKSINAIIRLAETTQSCFVTAPEGKGYVNIRHPLYRGVFGFAGHTCAEQLLQAAPDLVLGIGANLGEWASGAWSNALLNSRFIHLDSSEEHFSHSPMARLHVCGNIEKVCESLVELLQESQPLNLQPPKMLDSTDDMLSESTKFYSDAIPIKPQRVMRELSLAFPPNTKFFTDCGNSMAWTVHYLQPRDRRVTLVAPDGKRLARNSLRKSGVGWLSVLMNFAPMGWGIGAAVGCARANPTCPVVSITGDGSYLMNGQELSVAVAEELTMIFVVMNDATLGMVKHGQRLAGAEATAHRLPLVDFSMQAASMGVPGFVIRSPADMAALDIRSMLARKGPTLLDIRIDGEEVPPMHLRMKVLEAAKVL